MSNERERKYPPIPFFDFGICFRGFLWLYITSRRYVGRFRRILFMVVQLARLISIETSVLGSRIDGCRQRGLFAVLTKRLRRSDFDDNTEAGLGVAGL